MTGYRSGPRYTPAELASLLRLPPPTREQAAVTAAAPVEPLLVVAGAGSGKTETMAARVVWLVANDYVRPEQVLGLTFTRKAAGELAHRVRTRLDQLRRRLGGEDLPASQRVERSGARGQAAGPSFTAGEPTVSTYHAFAARILTEHGVRAGFEPTARLLTEAARWQFVDALVRTYEGDMSAVTFAPSTVTDAVLALSAELAEHLVDPAEVARWTGRFTAELAGPPGRVYAAVQQVRQRQQVRLHLLPLVRAYQQRKREAEALDFGDQLARAARVAVDHPEVGAVERERFRVVLLDEYQDTSHAQVVLLRALFGGAGQASGASQAEPSDRRSGEGPVTAVGDPCQAIYGWRGASTGTLDRFPEQFGLVDGSRPAPVRQLTTSWRNRPEILAVANRLAGPLRAAGARVATLTAAPGPPAAPLGTGPAMRCTLRETYLDEAAWIADQLRGVWPGETGGSAGSPGTPPPTAAVLIRRRDQIPSIEAALRERGLPVEVVGLGGLLDTPEVRDVVCTLRVLADPTDGAALVRLLTGARWRIGPRDLVALHRRARQLASERTGRTPEGEPEVVPDRLEEAALSEALADLGEPPAYSRAGYQRLRGYARELAALRRRLDQPLPDLVADVERTTGLDVEVAVRAGTLAADAGLARGHLDALGEVAARFATEAPGATLSAFLAYLAAAEEEERGLAAGEVEVVEGAVQILTAHMAKGLEWDVVAVAGLTAQVWPPPARSSDHYLQGVGVLPFPLRGDAAGLPALSLAGASDQKGVEQARKAFEAAWKEHDEREERRLAYVAVTRARRLLLASGYWWGDGVRKPRGGSGFLHEIAAACQAGAGAVDGWAPEPPEEATNPTDALAATAVWPTDPLGDRRVGLEQAAALVRAAAADLRAATATDPGAVQPALPGLGMADPPGDPESQRWVEEVTLLLAERDRRAAGTGQREVPLPGQLTVSQLVTLRQDPRALARSLRRPMPTPPDPHARRGTAFHAWLEQHLGGDRLLDLDELPGAADAGAAPDETFDRLREAFLASEWAGRVPVAVEVPFATQVGGAVVRGRIDAVFRCDDGDDGDDGAEDGSRYEVVDWKTGRRPTGAAAEAAAVQLAAYRLAWAELAGVPVAQVRAGFHYVLDGVTVRPADLLDPAGLTALITGLPEAVGAAD